MFNRQQFNQHTFNFATTSSNVFNAKLKYANYSMPNSNFRLKNVEAIDDSGVITKDIYDIANTHGQGLRNYFHKRKTIKVSGTLYSTSKSGLQAAINSFKANMAVPSQTLYRLDDSGKVLTGVAYCDNWTFDRHSRTINVVRVDFDLVVLTPFLYNTVDNVVSYTGVSSSFSGSIPYSGGNFEAKPVITIAFQTWLSGVDTVAVQIWDNAITVSETITDSQTLVIDCQAQDVLLNSSGGRDFTGIFPIMARGSNTIDVTINGTWTADIYFTRPDTYV